MRLNALNRFLFSGFVSVRNGRPKDVLDHTSQKTFDEKLDCLRIPEMITGDSGETFEVVGILIDLGPFQAEGFQFCSGTLLTLRVLILGCKLHKELVPNSR